MMKPPVELHRLISAAIHDPDLAKRLREAPETVYAEFGVPEALREALCADPVAAVEKIGVHPNLQFKFLGQLGLLKLSSLTSVQPFLNTLEDRNGADS